MSAVTQDAVDEIFQIAPSGVSFYMSFFEIYGGKASDLLNGKKKLNIQEDENKKIQVAGLTEQEASSASDMNNIIEFGHA